MEIVAEGLDWNQILYKIYQVQRQYWIASHKSNMCILHSKTWSGSWIVSAARTSPYKLSSNPSLNFKYVLLLQLLQSLQQCGGKRGR